MADEAEPKDIVLEVRDGVGRILLDRPKALNALTLDKIEAMDPVLRAWAGDPAVRAVVIEGAGNRAFCAGGDIRILYDAGKAGDMEVFRRFFAEEYRLNHLIKTFPKPYVALIDGITMGGGVGVSVHGSHRVATENTVFAMPETGIGLFPDVGGTWFLPRLPGGLGLYLALTGARLKAADCWYAGLATHVVPADRLPEVTAALSEAEKGETESDRRFQAVTAMLDSFHEDPGPAPLESRRAAIDRCFVGRISVEEVLAALEGETGATADWAAETMAAIRGKCPFATKAAFRQLQVGAGLSDFTRCMEIEYRLSQRLAPGPNFAEGVRTTIIDKGDAPRWRPESLEAVDPREVDALFAPLPEGDLPFTPATAAP